MKPRIHPIVAAFALALSGSGFAAAPDFSPLYDSTPRQIVPSQTVYREAKGVFFENIVATGNGRFAFTSLFDGRILEIDRSGKTRLLAQIPGATSGIERLADGTLVVGGWRQDDRRMLWQVSPKGEVSEWVPLPEAAMPNGITTLRPGVLLVADSVKGLIWRVDVASKAVSVWSQDAQLGGFKPELQPAIPAVNGLKRHGGFLYASNMSLNQIVRIAIQPDGSAGAASVHAAQVFADDFAIDTKGTIFATTHVYDSVLRITQDGRVSVIGERAQGLQGATALAFDGARRLVVTTNGGVYVPQAAGIDEARIVRIRLR